MSRAPRLTKRLTRSVVGAVLICLAGPYTAYCVWATWLSFTLTYAAPDADRRVPYHDLLFLLAPLGLLCVGVALVVWSRQRSDVD
jgi:hypothetical protein